MEYIELLYFVANEQNQPNPGMTDGIIICIIIPQLSYKYSYQPPA